MVFNWAIKKGEAGQRVGARKLMGPESKLEADELFMVELPRTENIADYVLNADLKSISKKEPVEK